MSNGNENIMHVEAVEGLMSEANAHLEMIDPKDDKEIKAKIKALREANNFQAGALHELRILCEGD